MPHRVAYLGFTEFERKVLSSSFGLARASGPAYVHVGTVTDADLLVADADHAPSVQLVEATEALAQTLFVGAQAPAGSVAWTPRPIDALRVLRELDRLVGADVGDAPSAAAEAPGAGEAVASAPEPPTEPEPPPQPATGQLPLTLRDVSLPTDAATEPGMPQIFPGGEGLVGHEQPRPRVAPQWTEDLAALEALAARRRPSAESPGAPATGTEAQVEKPTASRPSHPPRQPPANLQPPPVRALLVDDSALALLFLEKRLEGWPLAVDQATSSQAALARLAQQNYDLVFLDVDLGAGSDLDGLALCRQIKQTPELMNTVVVMVSAHHGEIDRVRGALAGCDAYFGKPVDEGELHRLLQRQGLRFQPAAVGAGPA